MLILMSASVSALMKSMDVNWLPWSVFMISGLPKRAMASSRASTQGPVSSVIDSRHAANVFESSSDVVAYAKNDHLGFQIYYMWAGSRRRYVPDFLVKLLNGVTLALEIKGVDSPQNRAKRAALGEWVAAVNAEGGFGVWALDVAFEPAQVQDIVGRHMSTGASQATMGVP